jgi:hypothetical protein
LSYMYLTKTTHLPAALVETFDGKQSVHAVPWNATLWKVVHKRLDAFRTAYDAAAKDPTFVAAACQYCANPAGAPLLAKETTLLRLEPLWDVLDSVQ